MDSYAATVAILAGSVLTWVSYADPVIYRRYALPAVSALVAIFLVIFTTQVMTVRAARNALAYDPNMVSFDAFSTMASAVSELRWPMSWLVSAVAVWIFATVLAALPKLGIGKDQ